METQNKLIVKRDIEVHTLRIVKQFSKQFFTEYNNNMRERSKDEQNCIGNAISVIEIEFIKQLEQAIAEGQIPIIVE